MSKSEDKVVPEAGQTQETSGVESSIQSQSGVVSKSKSSSSAEKKIADYNPNELIHLDPDDVEYPEELEVRPFRRKNGLTVQEMEFVESISKSIQEDGQIHPIVVAKKGEKYIGLTGQTRCMAISQINAGKNKGEEPLKVVAVVAPMPDTKTIAFRLAVRSNNQRTISPMDLALDIKQVKEHSPGMNNTKKLAEYFGVSTATVTQHLKLLELDDETQVRVHTGEISRDAAFVLAAVKPEKRAEVLKKAEEKTKEETAKTTPPTTPTTPPTATPPTTPVPAEAGAPATKPAKTTKPTKPERNTKTIKARNVRAAARDTEGASATPQKRTWKEIVAWADDNQGPAYGFPNGSIHKFLINFVKWCKGEISDRTLDKYFSEMVVKADKGKREEEKPKDKK